jgi:hypothetical protein
MHHSIINSAPREAFAWNLQWGTYFTQTLEFPADLKMVPTVEWTQMVLQSVVMPEGGETGLECLKFLGLEWT